MGALSIAVALPAGAAPVVPSSLASSATTPSLTLLPTTTTKPPATTTTHPPSSTTTIKPKSPPTTGVPRVPVGGPPTTAPPQKGTTGKSPKKPQSPPAPPPNPGPILAAVDANLSQLTAISDYKPAQEAVAAAEQEVSLATRGISAAVAAQGAAEQTVRLTQGAERLAEGKLTNLAILAYVGFGYGTLSEPPDGVEAADGQVMLQTVADQVRKGAAAAKAMLLGAEKAEKQAADATAAARQKLSLAKSDLTLVRRTLALVIDAAQNQSLAEGVDFAALPGLVAAGATPHAAPGTSSAKPPLSATTTATSTTTSPPTSLRPPSTELVSTTEPLPASPSILGPSILDGAELAQWFASTGRKANLTVSVAQLGADYETAGKATGVAYDVAFAQSVVETGWFSFPSYGQVTSKYNNFAGIGACDSCAHGWSFKTALQGVEAQMELLEAYASPDPVSTPLVGPVGIGGCCTTWISLAGKWATSLTYGISIMTVYNQMLAWIIPQRLTAAGLAYSRSSAHA